MTEDDLPVNDMVEVTVFDPRDNLVEEIPCFVCRQATLRDNIIEQFTTRHILIDKENICGRVNNFV